MNQVEPRRERHSPHPPETLDLKSRVFEELTRRFLSEASYVRVVGPHATAPIANHRCQNDAAWPQDSPDVR